MRSPGSNASHAPTNSSISTRVLEKLDRNERRREALLTRAREQSRILQLGEVGDRIGVAEGRRADADHRADIGAEPVLVGPIVLGDRVRIRPGAEEQREEAALEDVDESGESVVPFAKPAVSLLGRRERQRALRAEHAEESRLEADEAGRLDARRVDVRIGKFEIGILAEGDEFVGERARVADARLARIFALEPPQDGEQIEPPGLGDKLVAERHETPLSPMRGGQRMISPRSGRADDRLGEVVDRHVFGEEPVEDRAEQKRARSPRRPSPRVPR